MNEILPHTPGPYQVKANANGPYLIGRATDQEPVFIAQVEGTGCHKRHGYKAPGVDAPGNARALYEGLLALETIERIKTIAYAATVAKAPEAILAILREAEGLDTK